MYEEVCLLCGKPLGVDGRAYCSDECESLDATSPSASATSSSYASPFLQSTNTPGSLGDVPALVPSVLGRSLNPRPAFAYSKNRLSMSSSSTSSLAWDAFTDDEDDAYIRSGAPDEDLAELLAPDASKAAGSFGQLVYARRPAATNNRAHVPLLHRRTSSISSPSGGSDSQGGPGGADEDFSDEPASSSFASSRARPREPETVTAKSKRNRASLPAYFSLLTSSSAATSPASPRAQRLPSSISTLTALSRSLQSSPPTPRVAHPMVDPAIAYAQHQRQMTIDATPRGRGCRPAPRSPSCAHRDRSPSPPRPAHMDARTRARLDSVEKVADWVSHSPVVGAQTRGRTLTRRNSSPPAKPQLQHRAHLDGVHLDAAHLDDARAAPEEQIEHLREALARSLRVRVRADDEREVRDRRDREREDRRGRRRVEELDDAPLGVDRSAPGYGNGRSGLRAREGREGERGRPLAR